MGAGSPEQQLARERARQEALSRPLSERDAALREVRALYGPPATTSTTTSGPTDPTLARAAHEERQRERQFTAAERAKRAAPRDLDRERDLADMMDAGAAAAFDRRLQATETLGGEA